MSFCVNYKRLQWSTQFSFLIPSPHYTMLLLAQQNIVNVPNPHSALSLDKSTGWHLLTLAQRVTSLAVWTCALQLISCRLMGYFFCVCLSYFLLTMPKGYSDLCTEQITLLFQYCLTNIQELGEDWLRLAYLSVVLETKWKMPGVMSRQRVARMGKLNEQM